MASRTFRAPPLGRLQLACIEDAPTIKEIISESMAKTFRVSSISEIIYLIENCVLSICQLDLHEVIVGFIAVRDYPVIPAVHPNAWEEYIWTKYKAVELNARNTLFVHLICWNPIYSRDIVDNMLKTIFMHDAYLHHIAMVKTLINYPLLVPGQFRSEASFRQLHAAEKGVSGDVLPGLYIADRQEVSPRLRIRRAVEEDNDDIVPIIEAHSKRLRELYGEFYISELISRHPESERVLLVCEHSEVAVGVMCLNTQINLEALEESFELSPFAGLRKLSQTPLKRSKEVDSTVSMNIRYQSSMNNVNQPENLLQDTPYTDSVSRSKEAKSRVTWIFDDDEFKEFRAVSGPPASTHGFPMSTPAQLDILQLLEDEDELEFDIVNIDTDLMRVPRLLSYDQLDTGPAGNMKKLLDVSRKSPEPPAEEKKREKSKGSTSTTMKPPEPTRYSGSSNAFILEIFAMNHDYDERYGFDMLEVAYELFPDRDYCVICLPSNHASFPLLEHFTLVTGFSTRMKFINDTLYVAHVNSVRGNLNVRPGEAYDIPAMFDICERSPRAQSLLDLFESSVGSHSLECFVMLSENQPVGMIVLGLSYPGYPSVITGTMAKLAAKTYRVKDAIDHRPMVKIKTNFSPLEDGTTVRTQYDLEPEPRRPGTDGMVLTGIVSPALEPHTRWFLRELLRHSKYSTLFWLCRLFSRGDLNPNKQLISIAGHMTPVHPRRAIPNISGNKDLDKIYRDVAAPFALWVLERPLTSLPKVYVNSSIVVVGASRTGLAFLETLLLGPTCQYLTFSNVTLVSEHGLPTVSECLRAADTCVPRDGRYTDRYLKSVPFYFYLDVMTAEMVGIDRKKKCIHLKGGGVKFYDELVLTCGQQFQHPDYLHGPLQLVKEVEQGKPCDRVLMDDPKYKLDMVPQPSELPENVMLINSLFEANICLRKLVHMISDTKDSPECLSADNPIIVYGDCIEAYSCIAALLELGIFSEMIIFIEPFPPDDPTKLRVNCFNNETVDQKVQANLDDLGIRVYRKYFLAGWQNNGNRVESISLMSLLQATCLPCFAMFYYGIKAINVSAFKAINECGLVYDGGLVVGTSFETNDPNVVGAGTCVKYSRRLYALPRAHRHYSSEDVGEALARLFLKKLDPFVMGAPDMDADLMPRYSSTVLSFRSPSHISFSSSPPARLSQCATRMPNRWQPVMKFESPIVRSATLPGPLYYMKVRKPGIELPMEVQMSLPHQGHTLITNKKDNYFRLQLNVLHCVESITCLSNKAFSIDILTHLYGKHEAFFNKLLTRFKSGLIDDLFEFFTQPWLSALYQETFQELLRDINDQDVGTVYDLIKTTFSLFDSNSMDGASKPPSISAKTSNSSKSTIAFDVPSFANGPKEARKLGTFRSVIDKFVARKSNVQIINVKPKDIPSECGQNVILRSEAGSFWNAIGGERIVMAHLANFLTKNSVTNSHYAVPDPEHDRKLP